MAVPFKPTVFKHFEARAQPLDRVDDIGLIAALAQLLRLPGSDFRLIPRGARGADGIAGRTRHRHSLGLTQRGTLAACRAFLVSAPEVLLALHFY